MVDGASPPKGLSLSVYDHGLGHQASLSGAGVESNGFDGIESVSANLERLLHKLYPFVSGGVHQAESQVVLVQVRNSALSEVNAF